MSFSSNLFNVLMVGANRVKVVGSFRPDGVSATVLDVKGKGFTVARSDVGKYTITFSNVGKQLVGLSLGIRANSLTNGVCVFGGAYDSSAKTLIVQAMEENLTVGADADVKFQAVDLADNANNEIYFEATFRNSDL